MREDKTSLRRALEILAEYQVTNEKEGRLQAILNAYPEPANHEPGTRFVVVEIPPEASDEATEEITEKVLRSAAEVDRDYDSPWDLFAYRQHNAPPGDVPAVNTKALDAAAKAACELVYPPKTNRAWDDVDDFERDCWRAVVQAVWASSSE
jgi:hypothetical protein